MNDIRDSRGSVIRAGQWILWSERDRTDTGEVVSDAAWNGGLKVGGRSLKNIQEHADWIHIIW